MKCACGANNLWITGHYAETSASGNAHAICSRHHCFVWTNGPDTMTMWHPGTGHETATQQEKMDHFAPLMALEVFRQVVVIMSKLALVVIAAFAAIVAWRRFSGR